MIHVLHAQANSYRQTINLLFFALRRKSDSRETDKLSRKKDGLMLLIISEYNYLADCVHVPPLLMVSCRHCVSQL
jgi:hypothetical protein